LLAKGKRHRMATMEEAEELDNKRQQLHEAFLAKRGHAIKELKKFVRLHYCPALPDLWTY
jgi:hypothetical protein